MQPALFHRDEGNRRCDSSGRLRCCWPLYLPTLKSHRVVLAIAINANVVAWQYLSLENLHCQRILNETLDGAPQWPRAIGRVIALAHEQLLGGRAQFQGDLSLHE